MLSGIKIRAAIEHAFGKGELSRDGINFAVSCPICNEKKSHKKKLVVRIDDGRYHCWVCEARGKNIASLAKKYSPSSLHLFKELNFFGRGEKDDSRPSVSLPKEFVLLSEYKGKDPDILSVRRYLSKRGLSKRDIARWRIGACAKGSYRRRAIFPSFDSDGKLNYYVARSIDDLAAVKYKNPRIKKTNVIFNEIDLDWSKPIVLVEGVFDAIKSPENAVPILGSQLSVKSRLFQELIKNSSEVYLSLDADAKDKAYKIAKDLSRLGSSVYISFVSGDRDLGSMTKIEVREILSHSINYAVEDLLYHKIGKIKSGSIV